MTAYVLRDQISPEQALVINHTALAAFKIGLLPAGLFVLAAAIAALMTHELGRILAWTGIVIGVVTIVVATVTGLNIGRAGFSPTYLVVGFWLLAISLVWGFARSRPKAPAAVTSSRRYRGRSEYCTRGDVTPSPPRLERRFPCARYFSPSTPC